MKLLEKYKMDLIAESRTDYREAILSLLDEQEGAELLDLGSGDYERLTLKAANKLKAAHVATVDIADVTFMDERDGRPYTHYRGDLNDLTWAYPCLDKFDVVLASQIIEHLWNTDGFVEGIYRSLRPNGYAIVSTPNLASWHNALYLLLGKQPETCTVSDQMYSWKEAPGHRRVFTTLELIKMLKYYGFEIERIVGTSYYPLSGAASKALARLDWRHAGTVTIKVRK